MRHRKDVRAGIFVVLAVAVLAAGTLWIVGFSPWSGGGAEFDVLMKGSSGVRGGDRIRISGVEVGRVERVELRSGHEWPVRFRVSIDEGVALRRGSSARITSDGLLGAPYLEIVAGPPDAAPLPPGSEIFGSPGGDLMQVLSGLGETTDRLPRLLEQAGELMAKLNEEISPLLDGLQRMVSEENVDAIGATIEELRGTLGELRPRLPGILDRLDSLAGQLETGAGEVPELMTEARGLVAELRGALGPDGARLERLLESADSTLGSAGQALATVEENGPEIEAMLRDLREAAANLRSLSQTLKERPGLLLRSPRVPDREGEEERP